MNMNSLVMDSSIVMEKLYHVTHGRNIYLVEDMDKISKEYIPYIKVIQLSDPRVRWAL